MRQRKTWICWEPRRPWTQSWLKISQTKLRTHTHEKHKHDRNWPKRLKNRTMKKTWTWTTWTHSKPWKEYNENQEYCNPNLGLAIKAKACDKRSGQGKRSMNQTQSHKIQRMKKCKRRRPNTPNWKFTLKLTWHS